MSEKLFWKVLLVFYLCLHVPDERQSPVFSYSSSKPFWVVSSFPNATRVTTLNRLIWNHFYFCDIFLPVFIYHSVLSMLYSPSSYIGVILVSMTVKKKIPANLTQPKYYIKSETALNSFMWEEFRKIFPTLLLLIKMESMVESDCILYYCCFHIAVFF